MECVVLISLIDNSPTVFYNAAWIYWSDERIWENHETLHQVRKCTYKAKISLEIPAQKHNQQNTVWLPSWQYAFLIYHLIISLFVFLQFFILLLLILLLEILFMILFFTYQDEVRAECICLIRYFILVHGLCLFIGSIQRSHI